METIILARLNETTKELLETISLFTPEQFNAIPFEGSWTAGQVAEHLLKSETNVPRVWRGHTQPTTRPPGEKAGILEKVFLDTTNKLKAPDFIIPSAGPHEKETIFRALKDNRAEIKTLAEKIDLSLTFTGFSFPQLGELTGIEWLTFIITHSARHINQLKNIYSLVRSN
jgi:uncharacterized damage-inducible protein DinB